VRTGYPASRGLNRPGHGVVKLTFERHSDRETAAAAELFAIRDEDPVWNVRGRPFERSMQWMAAYPDKHADDISLERTSKSPPAACSVCEKAPVCRCRLHCRWVGDMQRLR
jgi:hypothetical protein